MRTRFIAGVITLFVVVGVVLGIVLLGPSFLAGASTTNPTGGNNTTQASVTTPQNDIVRENAQPGTYSWMIPTGKESSLQIQAYASSTSVLPGKSIIFYVSTQVQGTPYTINIYRLGWYAGFGGRLMATSDLQMGQEQGYYNAVSRQLINCATCITNAQSSLVEANWKPSYTLAVPSTWTTGVYLAKFIDAKGMQTYVPFDVLKPTSTSTYIAVTPDTTYAAYNAWGGSSLYETEKSGGGIIGETDTIAKGTMVSFDRPYAEENGSSQVLVFEADAIRWMERQGYDISYMSNVDVQTAPGELLQHKAYISLGHDEYWTKEMRDGVEAARDSGVGLAFMGADAAYWQMRFEPDSAGVPNRTIVCYKVATSKGVANLARDPFYQKDNTRLTAQWRDPILNRPENSLIGIMYSDLTHKRLGYPWHIDPAMSSPSSSMLDGTGLQAGQVYGCNLVGYEWDRVFTNGHTPTTLHIVATSKVINDSGSADTSNTTYYTASSGAMVFASGSIYWANALDNYRAHVDKACSGRDTAIPGIQQFMAHIMDEIIVRHTVTG